MNSIKKTTLFCLTTLAMIGAPDAFAIKNRENYSFLEKKIIVKDLIFDTAHLVGMILSGSLANLIAVRLNLHGLKLRVMLAVCFLATRKLIGDYHNLEASNGLYLDIFADALGYDSINTVFYGTSL